ncbi:choline ABC transporter ATP-binding protein [Oceanobacter sp. 5_MG-2023]|uniref:choline ABC transporter ATP-binding protein n=2 Tax=Gammaproteobacteria TaxID=1236 RepID=UPI0026E24DA7|nr:choline ABC transporter ATP-binding protein [Oceanobacter sp. 5_MG-2023]MDO6682450.1 choline ABC transporter ATP-binding protein [Oceanobacter sp. 5_MG-2023]
MNAISIRNLDVVFGDTVAPALALLDQGKTRQQIIESTGSVVGVHNASIEVKQGEICVLMGLSGSGKSSLLRAVNGLNPISRGQVLVKDGDGQVDVGSCDANTLRRLRAERVSMVFQKFALMPWLSVLDNVAYGLELMGQGKAERHQKAMEKLDMVGLTDWKDALPAELSGGMQQRVGLARAFAMDSDILLMDEPFSALDPLIRAQLQDELLVLQRSLNKTILFVSHDLDEALKIGTNIVIMESARIIQQGAPEDIVMNPATAYVEDFVAHTNPLNVLAGRSLMTAADELTRQGNDTLVCSEKDIWLASDGKTAHRHGEPVPMQQCGIEANTDMPPLGTMAMTTPDISMRRAIEIRYATEQPVVLAEHGKLVGVLTDHNFYHAMLGKHFNGAATA